MIDRHPASPTDSWWVRSGPGIDPVKSHTGRTWSEVSQEISQSVKPPYSNRVYPSTEYGCGLNLLSANNGEKRLVPYSIYLDESFYEFWGLQNPQGSFCYAVFGLADNQAAALREFHKGFLQEFQAAVGKELKEEPPRELKSVLFRRLPVTVRRRLWLGLRRFMLSSDSFVLADFTPVRGFVLERVRSDLARNGEERLPDKWQPLYEQRQAEILKLVAQGGAGQAAILEWLVGTTFAGLAHYLASRTDKYEVYFDPRSPKEDDGVRSGILSFTKMSLQALHQDDPGRFKGVCGDRKSEELPGLQIADLMVGEVRNWFISNPEILSFGSGPQLVTTETSNMIFKHAAPLANPLSGRNFSAKRQRYTRLPPGLAGGLYRANEHSALPYFRNVLAKGLLSCVAEWGEFRHIDFGSGGVIDSIDDWETGLLA